MRDFTSVDLRQLTGLEVLIAQDYEFVSNGLLATLKNLKELHFAAEEFVNREQLLSQFNYRRDGLKVYLFGFDVDQNLQVADDEDFPYGELDRITRFIVRNYEKTSPNVYHQLWVDYNQLVRNGLETSAAAKFRRLYYVQVTDPVQDEHELLNFLKHTQPLTFSMNGHMLSGEFLDQFALQCPFVQRLEFKNLKLDNRCPEFIFRMENLLRIEIYQEPSLDFAIRAFANCHSLTAVFFYFSDDHRDWVRFEPEFLVNTRFCGDQYWLRHRYYEDATDFSHFLMNLRKLLKLENGQPLDLRRLQFAVDDYKLSYFIEKDHVKRLLRNQLYYIYSGRD